MNEGMSFMLKLIIIIVILVVILSFVEMYISKNIFQEKYRLPIKSITNSSSEVMTIKIPNNLLFSKNKLNTNKSIIVIFNKSFEPYIINYLIQLENEYPTEFNRENYMRTSITIHFSSVLKKQIEKFGTSAKNIFSIGTPINDAINTITNGAKLFNTADITQPKEIEDIWYMCIPKGSKLKCFIDGTFLYIM